MPQFSDVRKNSDVGISDFQISGQSLIKENCHNSKTSDDIDMKVRPVTKFDKRNKTISKMWTLESYRKIMTSLIFFLFLGNLEQPGGRIPDTESAKVMFSVIGIFFLTITQNRTKKSPTELSYYRFE